MLFALMREMRINQWTKNILVYAALLFGGGLFHEGQFILATQMFSSFCLVSSGVYFINDIFDVEKDRVNCRKKNRPIASGEISVITAWSSAIVLFSIGLVLSYIVSSSCFFILLSYIILNFLYTIWLKHMVILDVMIIAYGFVARAASGAMAIQESMTMWFMLCGMFLSLFLALGKRRHELWALEQDHMKEARAVLQYYTIELIDQLMTIVTAGVLMCYALFVMDNSTRDRQAMIITLPLVIYGVFYYLYIVRVKHSGGAPDEALYREKPILTVVLLYVFIVIVARNF